MTVTPEVEVPVAAVEEVKVGEKRPLETETTEVKKEEVAAAPVAAEATTAASEEKTETEEPEAKKAKVEEEVAVTAAPVEAATKSEEAPKISADRLAVIKKQMEYYFSDDNLKFDRFFHKIIAQNENGYINIEHFLNCKKLIALGCTEQEIIAACTASPEIEVQGKEVRRMDNKALPSLEERKNNKKDKKGGKQSIEDVQLFAAINFDKDDGKGVHIALKNGLAKAMEEKFGKGKKDFMQVAWTFKKGMIEDLPNAICLIFGGVPENDEQKEEVLNMSFSAELLVGKDDNKETLEFKCVPVTDKATRSKIWEATPAFLQKRKQLAQKQQKVEPAKFTVEGSNIKFTSHSLRLKVKDILNARSLGEPIAPDSKDYKFISALLKHHPNQAKFAKMTGLKVDAWSENDDKQRCFFIIREDGTTDNVSLMKCVTEFEKSAHAKPEEKKEEAKKEEAAPVEEVKKEEVKVEEAKKEEAPKEEATKEEAPKTEEVKVEEAKKEEAPKTE